MMARAVQIAIAGSGLTAQIMARSLAETGYDVLLFPADRPPAATDSRTTTIHAAGKRMLDCLGIWQNLSIRPEPICRIRLAEGAPAVGGWSLDFGDGHLEMAYTVDNHALAMASSKAIADDPRLQRPDSPLAEIIWQDGRPVLQDVSGQLWQPELLVACDGQNSPARTAAGLGVRRARAGQTALVARLQLGLPHHQTAWQRFLPGGPLALMPLADQGAAMVWSLPDEQADQLAAESPDNLAADIQHAFGEELGQLQLADRPAKWKLAPNFVPRRSTGHLILAGDAAHMLHPLAGMGFNLALADAAVLADSLVAARRRGLGADHASILADYEQRRKIEVAALSLVTQGINGLFSTRGRAGRHGLAHLAGIGMGVLGRSHLRQKLARLAMGGVLAPASLLAGRLPG